MVYILLAYACIAKHSIAKHSGFILLTTYGDLFWTFLLQLEGVINDMDRIKLE